MTIQATIPMKRRPRNKRHDALVQVVLNLLRLYDIQAERRDVGYDSRARRFYGKKGEWDILGRFGDSWGPWAHKVVHIEVKTGAGRLTRHQELSRRIYEADPKSGLVFVVQDNTDKLRELLDQRKNLLKPERRTP